MKRLHCPPEASREGKETRILSPDNCFLSEKNGDGTCGMKFKTQKFWKPAPARRGSVDSDDRSVFLGQPFTRLQLLGVSERVAFQR